VRCAKCLRSIVRILDRPLPCGSDGSEPAAVADEPLHGWEVGPPDSFHQAASNERGGVAVPLCEPSRAEVMSALLLSNTVFAHRHTRLDFLCIPPFQPLLNSHVQS
jgi:hypothetical protein